MINSSEKRWFTSDEPFFSKLVSQRVNGSYRFIGERVVSLLAFFLSVLFLGLREEGKFNSSLASS